MKSSKFNIAWVISGVAVVILLLMIFMPTMIRIGTDNQVSGNLKKVEEHIKNVNEDISASIEQNNSDTTIYDGIKSDGQLGFTYPDSDTITCGQYKIQNGKVLVGKECTSPTWNNTKYCYTVATGASFSCDNLSTSYDNGTIIYFDPVKGEACTKSDFEHNKSTEPIKTGCMKWYIFNDTVVSSTVNMVLDHNTTSLVSWSDEVDSNKGPATLLKQLKEDTDSWTGISSRSDTYSISSSSVSYTVDYSGYKARLLSANEIATITTNTAFNEKINTGTNWYYLDNGGQVSTSSSNKVSKFYWLFDNTIGCSNYGCKKENDYTSGYWLVSPDTGSTTSAWRIRRDGAIATLNINSKNNSGVRPVITIDKAQIQ